PHVLFSLRFSLLPRSPPSSTLFPYTTLFRSPERGVVVEPRPGLHPHRVGHAVRADVRQRLEREGPQLERPRQVVVVERRLEDGGDRKSTRLNSSHVKISYAVFCLKKKKNSHT